MLFFYYTLFCITFSRITYVNCILTRQNKGLIMTCLWRVFLGGNFYIFLFLTVPMFRVTCWFMSKHNCPWKYKDVNYFGTFFLLLLLLFRSISGGETERSFSESAVAVRCQERSPSELQKTQRRCFSTSGGVWSDCHLVFSRGGDGMFLSKQPVWVPYLIFVPSVLGCTAVINHRQHIGRFL